MTRQISPAEFEVHCQSAGGLPAEMEQLRVPPRVGPSARFPPLPERILRFQPEPRPRAVTPVLPKVLGAPCEAIKVEDIACAYRPHAPPISKELFL